MTTHRSDTHEETFTVAPASGGGPGPFAEALARKIESLAHTGSHVVLVSPVMQPARYAQLIVCGCGIHAETASNYYLADSGIELDDDQELALVELGWHPPAFITEDPEDREDEYPDPTDLEVSSANWWCLIPTPTGDPAELTEACRTVAELFVATLLGVHGVNPAEPIEVQAFPASRCIDCGW